MSHFPQAAFDKLLKESGPVMLGDKVEQFTIRVEGGRLFRCSCLCNVFHKPDSRDLELYECNGCGTQYRGE